MSISNFKSRRKVSVYTVARREHFKLGVLDYRAGASWREIENQSHALDYERGRQFAACYSGRIYRGGGMERQAKDALGRARAEQSII
jgi:hypothetical protein